MSRSGYSDDCSGWELIMYRGRVASAIRGNRGQKFLKEMLTALDEMPVKELVKDELEVPETGEVCALGCLAKKKGLEMKGIEPYDSGFQLAKMFDIAECLANEVMYENDAYWSETPENRWKRMREWVAKNIKPEPLPSDRRG